MFYIFYNFCLHMLSSTRVERFCVCFSTAENNSNLFIFNLVGIFRLWAEVFHVAASGAGQVKWQQVSEDLVPVNITCIQDSPECIFHITAYNSQVDKILDVRLVQPGECGRTFLR